MLRRTIIAGILRPIIRAEIPGWGRLYQRFIGSWPENEFWDGTPPKIIHDKRCGYYRIVNIAEWADRSLYFLGRWYDLEAALLVEALVQKGDRVLDVGANYGHFTLEAAKAVGSHGSVVSFEPSPKSFARLSMHLDLNRLSWVEPVNIGLSDAKGRLELKIPRINSGEATFGSSRYEDYTAVEVAVDELDNIVGDRTVDFVKIDVEGFEVHVLRGAKHVIARDQPLILTEVVERHLKSAGESPESLSELLGNAGYKPHRLGLRGLGGRQSLQLSDRPAIEGDGDYLWLPRSKLDRIASLIR